MKTSFALAFALLAGCDCDTDPYGPLCPLPDLPTIKDAVGEYCAPELVVFGRDEIVAFSNIMEEADNGARVVVTSGGLDDTDARRALAECNHTANLRQMQPTACVGLKDNALEDCAWREANGVFESCATAASLQGLPGRWAASTLPTQSYNAPVVGPRLPLKIWYTRHVGAVFAVLDAEMTTSQRATFVRSEVLLATSGTKTPFCHASNIGAWRACGGTENFQLICAGRPL